MKIGLIIAAGKQSRFKENTPKCLASINGKCILDSTIENMNKYCDKVYVVCSNNNESYFQNYNHISIISGLGSGDAILRAINYLTKHENIKEDDSLIIQWGDALVNETLYNMLDSTNECIIPCTIEKIPYVQLIDDYEKINEHQYKRTGKITVKFSKYNDQITSGYHDMCIFSCNILYLKKYLDEFYNKFYISNHYNHKHGNEFEFLDVFNDTDCKAKIIKIDDSFATKSFNTVEELITLGGNINAK